MEVLISKNSVKDEPKLLAILGPTAVGKSKLGIEIAKRIGGEIVNADSLQVYRYLDIGTAKPRKEEREQVPHHLIDIIDPNKDFNAGLYRKTAVEVIRDLYKRSAKMILVGGTYIYVKLKSFDSESASRIHPNDYVRIERAL